MKCIYRYNEILYHINTVLCPIKVYSAMSSNMIKRKRKKITVHSYCYCFLDLLCVTFICSMSCFSSLKRVVRYLSDPKALSKYLRRVAKKHSPCNVDFNLINPAEIGSVFCIAIRGILPKNGAGGNDRMTIEAIWSAEVEASW